MNPPLNTNKVWLKTSLELASPNKKLSCLDERIVWFLEIYYILFYNCIQKKKKRRTNRFTLAKKRTNRKIRKHRKKLQDRYNKIDNSFITKIIKRKYIQKQKIQFFIGKDNRVGLSDNNFNLVYVN